jgi:iron complex transport system permease protein
MMQRAWAPVLIALALAVMGLGAGMGSTGWQWPWEAWRDPGLHAIVWDIRVPRTLGAWLAGALLGLSGAIAQGLFRNPLADPFLLGSSSGAALGVALVLAASASTGLQAGWAAQLGLTGAAFVGSLAAVALTLALSRGAQHTPRLLLAGIVCSVVLGAVTQAVLLLAADILRAMQAFLLGNTALLGWTACAVLAPVLLAATVTAWLSARLLDALTLGEDTARSLGVPLARTRAVLVVVLALAAAAAVAQAGLVAFVGLVAPHLVRGWGLRGHRQSLPASALMGGLLLQGADVASRSLMPPQELPVGVLTAVLGGAYLLWLMHRRAP